MPIACLRKDNGVESFGRRTLQLKADEEDLSRSSQGMKLIAVELGDSCESSSAVSLVADLALVAVPSVVPQMLPTPPSTNLGLYVPSLLLDYSASLQVSGCRSRITFGTDIIDILLYLHSHLFVVAIAASSFHPQSPPHHPAIRPCSTDHSMGFRQLAPSGMATRIVT